MTDVTIAIDIGGTKIAAALVDAEGRMYQRRQIRTPRVGRTEILRMLQSLIETLCESAPRAGYNVIGIGIGTAGQVDFRSGTVLSGTDLIRDWNQVPLRSHLHETTHLPVYVDNDVNAMALCETSIGAAVGHRDVVCLALGTGVGGGVLVDGKLLRGARGAAAELGHVSVNLFGPLCNCGMRGCLELYCSGPSVLHRWVDRCANGVASQTSPLFERYHRDPSSVSTRDVFALAEQGDPDATAVTEEMLSALSVAVVGFVHTFNATAVVLGGGVMTDGTWVRDQVDTRIRSMGMQSLLRETQVCVAKCGPDAGLIGAGLQCFYYREPA